jgi:hypothetical protein
VLLGPPPSADKRTRQETVARKVIDALGPAPRGGCPPKRWAQLHRDARRFFSDGWGHQAHALGWHPLELLGVDAAAPWARHDHMGLVVALNGRDVMGITETTATLRSPNGARQPFYRMQFERDRVVMLDEIEADE